MNKKIIIIVLVVVLISIASYFYITDKSKTVAANSIDNSLINNVVELEKSLVLAEIRKVTFEDFKGKTDDFIHPYYSNEFFSRLEKLYNGDGNMAVVTQVPYFIDISKVYTSEDSFNKYIFVKIHHEGFENLAGERYTFIKDDGEWKIRVIGGYVFSLDMKRPIKDVETFTNFNGTPIEYESIKILDNLK